ncbi:hypothetical protein [Taibaiella koreensis]|uniref:hypothetical protein n=1 Tax=Taibaiella koreensis TaxID=1268548 RepID=UPI000E59ECC9|nr:hypothetical protein [Taibaiella koreensis]
MDNNLQEDEYLNRWYSWEIIYDESFSEEIEPEEVVAINRGFGTTQSLLPFAGQIEWNQQKKRFLFSRIKVEKSKRISFYGGNYGLFKITDLTANKYYKVLMQNDGHGKVYSDIEKCKEYRIDDSNTPIYKFNELTNLNFSDFRDIRNYVLFFFFNVKGRHGKFYPISSEIDTLPSQISRYVQFNSDGPTVLSNDDISNQLRARFGNDPDLEMTFDNGQLAEDKPELTAEKIHVVFRGAIFSSNVILKQGKEIALSNEELIIDLTQPTNYQPEN